MQEDDSEDFQKWMNSKQNLETQVEAEYDQEDNDYDYEDESSDESDDEAIPKVRYSTNLENLLQ